MRTHRERIENTQRIIDECLNDWCKHDLNTMEPSLWNHIRQELPKVLMPRINYEEAFEIVKKQFNSIPGPNSTINTDAAEILKNLGIQKDKE